MLNKGFKKSEVAEKLGIHPSILSTRLSRGLKYSYIIEYYIVDLASLPDPSYYYIVESHQRINVGDYFRDVKPDIILWNPIPRPTYLLLYLSPLREPVVEYDAYVKVRESGRIESTYRVLIDEDGNTILEKVKGLGIRDYYDYIISVSIAKLYTPPLATYTLRELANLLLKYVGKNTFYYHWYNHLYNRVIYKQYVYISSMNPTYCMVNVSLAEEHILHVVIDELYGNGILSAIEVVYMTGREPYSYIVLGWCDRGRLYDYRVMHGRINNAFYEIHPLMIPGTATYIYL